MSTPGFDKLTDDVRRQVKSIVATLSIDGALHFALLDASGDDLVAASATNIASWDKAKDLIGPLLNQHGLAYDSWRLVPRQFQTWHAEVRPLASWFNGGQPE